MSNEGMESDGLRVRTVGSLVADEETTIYIDHTFVMEGDGESVDEGFVGIMIEEGDIRADALLTAEEALLLADRLTRAAHLVLEAGEDLPDPEREYRRYRGTAD